jgi:hypothetical protein
MLDFLNKWKETLTGSPSIMKEAIKLPKIARVSADAQAYDETGADEITEMQDLALVAETASIELCPICGRAVEEQRGKYFKHIWCPRPGHFDAWRSDGGRKLSDTGAPIIRPRGGNLK